MKPTIKPTACAALASLFILTAIAAQKPSDDTAPAADSMIRSNADRSTHLNQMGAPIKASDLIGRKIQNQDEKKIGQIEDLAVDLQAGRVVQVILSTGGFLSMSDRTIAVPPSVLHFDATSKPLRFDITQERIKSAPVFEMSQWKEFYQSDRVHESDRFYGEERAFDSMPSRNGVASNPTGPDGLGYVQKATKLMGLPVRNLQDDKIGEIENLIVDLPAGRVVAVIVSSGGFLGMGDTLSVVPPAALRFTSEHDRLRLDTTKEALRDAPHFKNGEWPDFAQRDYTTGIYSAYHVEPYFGRDKDLAADADNTARNVRDRGKQTLTPLDQGNSTGDLKITQQIRQEVTAMKGLSVNAQNVKIITVNGQVTLRGPVRTTEEKNLIGEIAARVARMDNVDNQLEITLR